MKNVFFIVGPHGVGKTYVVNKIKEKENVKHIDLGPLIRQAHKVFAPELTLQQWIEVGEAKYGKNFTDIILCKQIERLTNEEDNNTTLITGSRSLGGIEFIAKRFSIVRPKIIYITAPFRQLKANYEKRERISITDEKFNLILQEEKEMGLDYLEEYSKRNGFYLQNDNTDNFINTVQGFILNNNIERGNKKMNNKLIYLTTNPHKVEEANEII